MSGLFSGVDGRKPTDGIYEPTGNILNRRGPDYHEIVKEIAGNDIMSTEFEVPQSESAGPGKTKPGIGKAVQKRPPAIKKINVSVLSIDDSYDSNDPYNNTGQFMVDAIKNRYDE